MADTVNKGSFSDYAKHRGVSRVAVSKALKKGWLDAGLGTRDGKRFVEDFAAADRSWDAQSDKTRASIKEKARPDASAAPPAVSVEPAVEEQPPVLSPAMSLTDATKADKYWSAMRKKQEFEKASGELVNAAERDLAETTRIMFAKTKILGIPSKVRASLPHLTHADIARLDGMLREALEELGTPSPPANGAAA
jgi:phage terminase Nu1 subunit (DNA packaging protein)